MLVAYLRSYYVTVEQETVTLITFINDIPKSCTKQKKIIKLQCGYRKTPLKTDTGIWSPIKMQ